MRAKVVFVNGTIHAETISLLARMKLIVAIPCRNGYMVARWGVNKRTVEKLVKERNGS